MPPWRAGTDRGRPIEIPGLELAGPDGRPHAGLLLELGPPAQAVRFGEVRAAARLVAGPLQHPRERVVRAGQVRPQLDGAAQRLGGFRPVAPRRKDGAERVVRIGVPRLGRDRGAERASPRDPGHPAESR